MFSASYFFFRAAASSTFIFLPVVVPFVLAVIIDFLSTTAVDVGLNFFTLLDMSSTMESLLLVLSNLR
jgi:hypothetical protein